MVVVVRGVGGVSDRLEVRVCHMGRGRGQPREKHLHWCRGQGLGTGPARPTENDLRVLRSGAWLVL